MKETVLPFMDQCRNLKIGTFSKRLATFNKTHSRLPVHSWYLRRPPSESEIDSHISSDIVTFAEAELMASIMN